MCVVMYDAVCVTSLCELCTACYVYRVCVGFTSARMASPGDVVSLRSTRTVWMGCILGTSPGNEHAIRETTAVLAASERGNQYTLLNTVQYTVNFTVYCTVHSTIYCKVPGFKVPEPSDQQSNY